MQQTHLISYFQGLPKERVFENLPTYNLKIMVWFNLFKNTCTLSFPNSDLLCMLSAECCLQAYHNKGVFPKCKGNQRLFTDKPIWASRYSLRFVHLVSNSKEHSKVARKLDKEKHPDVISHSLDLCISYAPKRLVLKTSTEPMGLLAFTTICLQRTVNTEWPPPCSSEGSCT